MSKTQMKNGNGVFEAFSRLTIVTPRGGINFASTMAVAGEAGVSKPTAKKYLEMLVERGFVRKEKITGGLVLWVNETMTK